MVADFDYQKVLNFSCTKLRGFFVRGRVLVLLGDIFFHYRDRGIHDHQLRIMIDWKVMCIMDIGGQL